MPIEITCPAKRLGWLAQPDFCPQCFQWQNALSWRKPWDMFPGCFSAFDIAEKAYVTGYLDRHGRLPDCLSGLGEITGWIASPKAPEFYFVCREHGVHVRGEAECGQAIHLFSLAEVANDYTGEIETYRNWIGKLAVDASVLDKLQDEGDPRRRRRIIDTPSLHAAIEAIEEAAGHRAEWIGFHADGAVRRADVAAKAAR